MNTFFAYINILRPLNLMIGAFAVIITASILNSIDMVSNWLTALIVVVFSNGAANALNDYFDLETDKINHPHRPLVTGALKRNNVMILAIVLFSIAILLAFQLPWQATLIAVLIALPLMVFYSIWFKGIPLLGNLIIALILGLAFLFAGAALYNMEAMIILAVLAIGLTMVRELIKDIADYDGDIKTKVKTFPTVNGIKMAWRLTAILAVIVGIGAIIPYLLGHFNYIYFIILIFGIEIPLVITVFYGMKNPTIENAKTAARLLKFSTIMGVFAFWLGSF